MANYRELYSWMRTIYLIKNHREFDSDIKNHFSEGTLHILNSAMLPKQQIRFQYVYDKKEQIFEGLKQFHSTAKFCLSDKPTKKQKRNDYED